MSLPHPNNLNANQYPYGFGGYVADKQSKSYHSYYRSYDARLTRWKSTDPVIQPWQSLYTAYNNNPIRYVDPMGNVALCALVGVASAVGSAASQVGMYALRGMPTIAFNMILNNTNLFAANEANGTGRYFDNAGGGDDASANKYEIGGLEDPFILTNPAIFFMSQFLYETKKWVESFDNTPGGKWDFWGGGKSYLQR